MQTEKKLVSSDILFTAISEQLAQNRQAAFTVTGMSMWPLLCHGRDQVIVEKTDKKNVKIGDIILYRVSVQFAPSGGRKCVFQRPLCGAERPLVFS